MPTSHQEGRIGFQFPKGWQVVRPGKSAFYQRHFQHFCGRQKEMDFLLADPDGALWMLEVKDYTTDARTKPQDLMDEVAVKVRDSLAMLAAASANDHTDPAKVGDLARFVLPLTQIRVVLHLENPVKPSRLFPGAKLAADPTQLLRTKLRSVDARALVVSTHGPASVPWTSKWIRSRHAPDP